MEWLIRFQKLDRRVVYLLVILSIALALLIPFRLPQPVTPEVEAFYSAVEAVGEDQIVIVAADWGAGTQGECAPQSKAVIRHLFRSGRKFAIMGFDLQGPELTQAICEELAPVYGAEYGRDWCNWGYNPANTVEPVLLSLVQSITKTFSQDTRGMPVEEIPMMAGIDNLQEDVGLIAEFTGSGFIQAYLRRIPGVPIAQGCTAVIGPEEYTYLDSGQLVGLLVGMRGAAEYEQLLEDAGDDKDVKDEGREAMRPQSMAHLLTVLLILLGNLAVVAQRRRDEGARRR